MPKKKEVNADKLIKAVESGKPSTEIMEKFGFKTSAQLKAAYLDALVEKGMAQEIAGGRRGKSKAVKKANEVKVNKRGSLVLTKDMVNEMGFSVGELFKVRKTKTGVSLKKG